MSFWDEVDGSADDQYLARIKNNEISLEDAARYENCLNILRDQNYDLNVFFRRHVESLIRQIVSVEVDTSLPVDEQYLVRDKFFAVFRLLLPESYRDVVFNNGLMNFLLNFLHNNAPRITTLIATYYVDLLRVLIDFDVVSFIRLAEETKFLCSLLNFVQYSCVVEFLSIIVEIPQMQDFFISINIGKHFIDELASSDDYFTLENVGYLWYKMIQTRLVGNVADIKPDLFLEHLQNPDLARELIRYAFSLKLNSLREFGVIQDACLVLSRLISNEVELGLPHILDLTEKQFGHQKDRIMDPDGTIRTALVKNLDYLLKAIVKVASYKEENFHDVAATVCTLVSTMLYFPSKVLHEEIVLQLEHGGIVELCDFFDRNSSLAYLQVTISEIIGYLLYAPESVRVIIPKYLFGSLHLVKFVLDRIDAIPTGLDRLTAGRLKTLYFQMAVAINNATRNASSRESISYLIAAQPEAERWEEFVKTRLATYLAETRPYDVGVPNHNESSNFFDPDDFPMEDAPVFELGAAPRSADPEAVLHKVGDLKISEDVDDEPSSVVVQSVVIKSEAPEESDELAKALGLDPFEAADILKNPPVTKIAAIDDEEDPFNKPGQQTEKLPGDEFDPFRNYGEVLAADDEGTFDPFGTQTGGGDHGRVNDDPFSSSAPAANEPPPTSGWAKF